MAKNKYPFQGLEVIVDPETVGMACDIACTRVLLLTSLERMTQVPTREAKALMGLAEENGYEIQVKPGQIHLRNHAMKKTIGVKFIRVSDSERKWMFGVYVNSNNAPIFNPTGSFQMEINAIKKKIFKENVDKKITANTKISMLEG